MAPLTPPSGASAGKVLWVGDDLVGQQGRDQALPALAEDLLRCPLLRRAEGGLTGHIVRIKAQAAAVAAWVSALGDQPRSRARIRARPTLSGSIERTHLTMRLFNSRLKRKTLGLSKQVELYRASAAWEELIYNFVRPLKTLRVEVHNDPRRR